MAEFISLGFKVLYFVRKDAEKGHCALKGNKMVIQDNIMELLEKIDEIEPYSDRNIDGRILSNICRMAFHGGFKKKEMSLLKIGDVKNLIQPGGTERNDIERRIDSDALHHRYGACCSLCTTCVCPSLCGDGGKMAQDLLRCI